MYTEQELEALQRRRETSYVLETIKRSNEMIGAGAGVGEHVLEQYRERPSSQMRRKGLGR